MRGIINIFFCMLGGMVLSAPIDAVLIVQNHVGKSFDRPMSSLANRFSGALSGELFSVIDPGDVIGDRQNVDVAGERMPQSSAMRLAEACGAGAAITVSLDGYSVISIGNPVLLKQRTLTLSIQAKCVATGAAVRGITRKFLSRKYRPADFEANADSIYDDLVGQAVAAVTKEFIEKMTAANWKVPVTQKVEVAFGSNIPGADVSIDGISYGVAGVVGKAPLKVRVLPGVHNVRVSFPTKTAFETRGLLMPNSTFMVVLRENAEGRAQREHDAHFAALMDRFAKSGATDDLVRSISARGYANYLSASCHRIEGMPQTLSLVNSGLSDPGLSGNGAMQNQAGKHTEAIIREIRESTEKKEGK